MSSTSDLLQTVKVKVGLLADRRVSGLDINVVVDNGVARLTGVVDSEEEKNAAEDVASGIEGVIEVENEIVVSPSVGQMTESEEERLAGMPEGVPMIGLAAAPPAYGGIAPGVSTVRSPTIDEYGTDEDIADTVRESLRQDERAPWSHIQVCADLGIVYLSGKVRTLDQFMIAEQIASDVPGVKAVKNELEIEESGSRDCFGY
jgi:osmotically-inducible protein OsmY